MSENSAFIPDTEAARLLAEYTEAIVALTPRIQEGLGGVALHGTTADAAETWQEQVFSAAMALRHFSDTIIGSSEPLNVGDVSSFDSNESSTFAAGFTEIDEGSGINDTTNLQPADAIVTEEPSPAAMDVTELSADDTETAVPPVPSSTSEATPPTPRELELQVMEFALHGVFRMEELHRAIPSLAILDNKSPEWAKFKNGFEKMIESIQARIATLPGGAAGWRFESRQRGKKYILEASVNGEPLSPEQVADLFPIGEESTDEKRQIPSTVTAPELASSERPIAPARPITPAHIPRRSPRPIQRSTASPVRRESDTLRAQRQTIDFAVRALDRIRQAEAEIANGGILGRDILRTIQEPDTSGKKFSQPEAEAILQSFRNSGDLIRLPGEKGHVKYTTDPTKAAEYSAKRQQAVGERLSKEEERIAELLDTHGDAIVSFLGKLGDKTKSEFKTTIAEKVGNSLAVDDVNALCRKLKQAGLVESVDPKGRGTGRTRKGVTWRLTNKGRAHADALEAAKKGLTAAQKKQISDAYRQ